MNRPGISRGLRPQDQRRNGISFNARAEPEFGRAQQIRIDESIRAEFPALDSGDDTAPRPSATGRNIFIAMSNKSPSAMRDSASQQTSGDHNGLHC